MVNKKEKVTTIPQLAKMMRDSFQSHQDYMDKRLHEVKTDLKADIKKVDTKLDTFLEDYREEKIPMRVEYIENTLNIPKIPRGR